MNSPVELYRRAAALGLRLEPRGDKLAVSPAAKLPPDFAAVLRLHKRELLHWLETRSTNLPPDCIPWLHIARQILAGEFDGANDSTREALRIGLRLINDPRCSSALQRLTIKPNHP